MFKKIKLTETDLHRIIKESVEKVLNEGTISQESYNLIELAVENLDTEQILGFFCMRMDDYEFNDILKELLENTGNYNEVDLF